MHPDVLLVFAPKDNALASRAIQHLQERVPIQKVVTVTNNKNRDFVSAHCPSDVQWIDEDLLIPGVSYDTLTLYFIKRQVSTKRVGWYYQQFLKMAYCFHTQNSHYLIWDADTLLLRPLSFFSNEGKTFLSRHARIHEPYFVTLQSLLGFSRQVDFSFIGEHMMVQTSVMRELIQSLNTHKKEQGGWVWRILDTVDDQGLEASGFSEFETYGNYLVRFHPEKVMFREVAHFRDGARYFGHHPTRWDLERLAKSYHYVTFESSRKGKWRRVALQRLLSLLSAGRNRLLQPGAYKG